jgi:23S rRNA (guanosine2251-2'-O)-methyltransferase
MKRVVVGPRAVEEAIRADASRVHVVYADERGAATHRLTEMGQRAGVTVETRPAAALDALAKGLRHQGVVALTGDFPYRSLDEVVEAARTPATLVLCDGIEDPQNLGAILRAAVFFGADGVVLPRHRAAPVTPAAVRASAGASEHAHVARVTNLADAVADLGERGFETIALAAEAGEALSAMDLRGPVALVVGAEHSGVRPLVRKRARRAARLPGAGTFASLNAAAAAAVALYEVGRQREVRA